MSHRRQTTPAPVHPFETNIPHDVSLRVYGEVKTGTFDVRTFGACIYAARNCDAGEVSKEDFPHLRYVMKGVQRVTEHRELRKPSPLQVRVRTSRSYLNYVARVYCFRYGPWLLC